ncbi:PrgI family protein [Candidatus Peregrinibacteria bacterium]|nr:PrgI family protein [Candidatus Peregrinibacteria bacterium]
MPIQPIKIPQNVYIEDRIVGPLTLKQIIIVCIGCGFSYAMWASISKSYGYVGIPLTILVWIPGALSVVFALIKVNDLSLLRIVFLLLERANKPTIRTWTPRRGISINIKTFAAPVQKPGDQPVAPKSEHLDALSSVLDAPTTPMTASDVSAPETSGDELTSTEAAESEVRSPKSAPPLPVRRDRISASPLTEDAPADGTAPRASVSLFRDISPA